MADLLDVTLGELADMGAVAVYTYGVINNRPIRGREEAAQVGQLYPWSAISTHSEGRIKRAGKRSYKCMGPWQDGQTGAYGLDLVKVVFKDGSYVVVTNPLHREIMIQWLEKRMWKIYHKKPLKTSDHLHIHPEEM